MAQLRFRALRMRHHHRLREFRSAVQQPPYWKSLMHNARALPDLHVLAARLLLHVVTQIAIGEEQDRLLPWNGVDNPDGIAGCAQDVAFRLHLYRCIDITDDDVIGIAALELAYRLD